MKKTRKFNFYKTKNPSKRFNNHIVQVVRIWRKWYSVMQLVRGLGMLIDGHVEREILQYLIKLKMSLSYNTVILLGIRRNFHRCQDVHGSIVTAKNKLNVNNLSVH